MSLHVVAVYHNTESRFFPYEDGHRLAQVISHWRHWPTGTDPLQIADWAWHVFNADLDMLESGRGTPPGEADFLIASTYRLMRRRSLSTGDVISITTEGVVRWLACEFTGWRQITAPANLTGGPLSAEAVYRHARGGGDDEWHPCRAHRPGHHDDACMSGLCGFCGTDLDTIASGECRACLLIVCEGCDAGYEPDRGPICVPCAQPGNGNGCGPADPTPPDGWELHRLVVFLLSLSCGHLVSLFVNGWYPVAVACCDRLGGTIQSGIYVAYASDVDYVRVISERYEHRPSGSPCEPDQLCGRWPRTDDPYRSPHPGGRSSTGRYPARVGAAWSFDGSTAPATPS